ncbi:MAG: bifunctional pyr operon transcriptional regulator/uracil phosphoribosyltransferase PyrR [Thiohalomonadaceae bacterium]
MTTQPDIEPTLHTMAGRLRELLAARGIGDPCMVGIHTGGVWVARRLHELLELHEPLGALDISFYRDDFSRIGVHPQVKPSNLPFDIEGRHIILVDDVLYTGRTIRAALNELFDYGRPASVLLVVLVERSGRELPIQADVAGLQMELEADQQVKLSGPDHLALTVQSHADR